MTELLDLCYDVLIHILEEVDPEDLASCAQTSWAFNNFIKKNTRLYKAHYLNNFDDPRHRSSDPEPEWVAELQKVVRCQKILQSADNDLKKEEFDFVVNTVETLISTASERSGVSRNQSELAHMFESISQNHDAFMCRSSLYERAGTEYQKPADDEESRQLSAKLHCYFGIPSTTIGRRVLSTHPYARSRVYDLRNYTDKTRWGPFREDGSMKVDWEMIESIMIILGYNSGLCCRRFLHRFRPPWTEPFEGIIKDQKALLPVYPLSLPLEPSLPLDLKDPYGISGIWSRIVCFLDYNDLYNFNFGSESLRVLSHEPRGPNTDEEAIRHIMMSLKVTSVESPGRFDNPELPVVHFTGKARSIDASWDPNANSRIRGKPKSIYLKTELIRQGTVRLTPEGEVRWTTISIFYGGEERWRSEGVQVGGPRSKRGVIGTWFDKDYDPHGPAGPTAFWKVCDKQMSESDDETESDSEGLW